MGGQTHRTGPEKFRRFGCVVFEEYMDTRHDHLDGDEEDRQVEDRKKAFILRWELSG